jgi:hypothetical protein
MMIFAERGTTFAETGAATREGALGTGITNS